MSIRLTVARAMGGETADALMKYMNNNDDERFHLDEVVDVFCEMAANESLKIPIMCFYETRCTDFSKIIHMLSEEEKDKLGKSSTGIVSIVSTSSSTYANS
jgi:phosphatidylglycerophosphatase A